MPGLYDTFRSRISWGRVTEGSDEIPGLDAITDRGTILARVHEKTTDLGEDLQATAIVWTLPGDVVKATDRLGGRRVVSVDSALDAAGNVAYWIAYVTD